MNLMVGMPVDSSDWHLGFRVGNHIIYHGGYSESMFSLPGTIEALMEESRGTPGNETAYPLILAHLVTGSWIYGIPEQFELQR